MKVICTEKSQILATRLARAQKTTVVDVKYSRFPDGELYLVAGELDDETVMVSSVVDNDALVQLLLLIDACENSDIRLVIPYMGYARQDRQDRKGEPLSARAVARAISRGVSECITVNIHEPDVLRFFNAPARNISLARDIGAYIKTLNLTNPLILAPDDGALAFAEQVASAGEWEFDHLEKTRLSGEQVTMAPKALSAASRPVVIVDDIISTGGTIATAAGMLSAQGATDVYAACVHGVLTGGAYVRLIEAGVRDVICSDTIERGCSRVSAADQIANALQTRSNR
ncbi:MAG: ribose-phosphate diphosphokinase [Methanomicrobiales archaeon HGW-Methanomicrobiales-1]|jgi:ribose-phosphate pyrophosphokinase|nr:MAG: ribose-phosphate diphosphokinase [Methanomicrobiales archaeon HGW-Methanomicrobiales-1]